MPALRDYISMIRYAGEPPAPASQPDHDLARLRQLAGLTLNEGLINMPDKILRIAGSPHDMYQLLKMLCNPNLAHMLNFSYSGHGAKAGSNPSEMIMVFYDDVSMAEAKRVFDHYKISYTDAGEMTTEFDSVPAYTSKTTPPSDADKLLGGPLATK